MDALEQFAMMQRNQYNSMQNSQWLRNMMGGLGPSMANALAPQQVNQEDNLLLLLEDEE